MSSTNYVLKKWVFVAVLFLCGTAVMTSCNKEEPTQTTNTKINYHCATQAEGRQLLLANTEYFNSLTQVDIDWRMRRTGATLDEMKNFAQNCVREFSDEDKAAIAKAVAFIERKLHDMGASLPFPEDDIVFIKTTMEEESDAGAYTHKTEVYVGEWLTGLYKTDSTLFYEIVAHEFFHTLTRNSPKFRSQMYNLIGFTTTGTDYVFAPAIQEMIITNPDVEHIDNYAEFTIDGVKRNCELLVLYTKTWAEASAIDGNNASFFNHYQCVLVPIDELDVYYPVDEVPDFWNVVGHNTEYVFAPEECLSDNFAYAVVYGPNGRDYRTPQLITKIIDLLQHYHQ